ncbi:MAG: dihydrodipicolinate synthase family protein [Limnochordia bacterium]|nr:dihydrodipicolinate synthase family protein [Limnochordia bacterium]
MKPEGVVVPIITPVNEHGQVDREGLRRLVNHLIKGGIRGIFPAGTTGEFARLADASRHELFRLTTEYCQGRAQVYAGVSDTSLDAVVGHIRSAEKSGVDACVISLPYYYSLSPEEAKRWFTAVIEATDLPVVLYNIPGNVGQIIPPDVIGALGARVAGMKDSGGDPTLMKEYLQALGGDGRIASFLAGSEEVINEAVSLGAEGVVPSMANVFPRLWSALWAFRHDKTIFPRMVDMVNQVNQLNTCAKLPLCSVLWKKRLLALEGICCENAIFPSSLLEPRFDGLLRQTANKVDTFLRSLDEEMGMEDVTGIALP